MSVELFVANKWYTFVPDLTTHNLWELVEQYKTGELFFKYLIVRESSKGIMK